MYIIIYIIHIRLPKWERSNYIKLKFLNCFMMILGNSYIIMLMSGLPHPVTCTALKNQTHLASSYSVIVDK